MENNNNTTIVYDQDSIIKGFEISGFFAQMLERFLLDYIIQVEDKAELLGIYKKIDDLSNGKDVKLDQRESYFYLLTAMVRGLRQLALEQKIAKEIPISEAAAASAKKSAELYLEGIGNKDKRADFYKSYEETVKIFDKDLS